MSYKSHPIVGLTVGLVLVLVAVGLAMLHERAAVAWSQGLARHGGAVNALSSDAAPDSVADGSMVKLSGVPRVQGRPRDTTFGVSADSAALVRVVDMFQWREVAHGQGVVYEQDWIDHPVDASAFREPQGHANTAPFPFRGETFRADQVRLGRFVLDPAIVKALPHGPARIKPSFDDLPPNLQASFQAVDGVLLSSADSRHPRLGDLRVSWKALPMEEVTVIARVHGHDLVPATDAADGQGFSVQLGERSLTDIHADLPESPGATWLWRAVAVLLAALGAWLLMRRRHGGRAGVMPALAVGVALVALVVGVSWLTASAAHAAVALGVAVLAAVYAVHAWKRARR